MYVFGNANRAYLRDLVKSGIEVKSDKVVITDKTILKYVKHPKRLKGATVSTNRFVMVEAAVKHPRNIYIDQNRDRIIYVGSVRYSKDKVLKVVIEPNQRIKGSFYNQVKSIGVVDKIDMNGKQYKKIK